jgi:Bacterial SH3 domain
MTVRKCSTCKHYEPAPIWRKGWCRNPLLYSPQQSHLVGEDDLDCDRGMGNYWEPLDGSEVGVSEPLPPELGEESSQEAERTASRPSLPFAKLSLRKPTGGRSQRSAKPDTDEGRISLRGGGSSRVPGGSGGASGGFGGSGRRGSSGGDGDDDDNRQSSPSSMPPPHPAGTPERQFSYYTEQRYWTDYLRIVAPVLGVILILALAWIWLNSLLGGGTNPPAGGAEPSPPLQNIIVAETPTATPPASTPIVISTPSMEDGGSTPETYAFAKGDTVVIGNTNGSGVNLRAEPNTDSEVVTLLDNGADLDITDGSIESDGFIWWPVETADGETGYVAEDFLVPAEE